MPAPSVGIVGAGLSGLTLGRCLASKGIAATVYEKELRPKLHLRNPSGYYGNANVYAITLHEWAYRPLMAVLGLDEAAFRKEVEILPPPSAQKGKWLRKDTSHILNVEAERDTMRCDRGKLIKLLCPGMDTEILGIRWGHAAQKAEAWPDGIEVSFDSRRPIKTNLLVGADGMRSDMRHSIVPDRIRYRTLPFIVYTGQRFLSMSTFRQRYAQFMKESSVIACYHGDIRLEISADEVHPSEKVTRLRWTYSRPMNADGEFLMADLVDDATGRKGKSAFQKELDALKGLKEPFARVFVSDRGGKDRIVNWIVRDTLASDEELQKSPDGRMALIGDAAHVMPVFGGREHSIAIQDGLDLAEHIAQNPSADLNSFVSRKYVLWKQASLDRERRLFEMHPSAPIIRKINTRPWEPQPVNVD